MSLKMSIMNCLPLELLEIIIPFVPSDSLQRLSSVSRSFRDLCSPLLFQSIQVGIAPAQFEGLLLCYIGEGHSLRGKCSP